jgi:hypothetical protein
VKVFAINFIDGITQGFKPESSYSDVTNYLCWYVHGELFVCNKSMEERVVGSTSSASNVHGVANDNRNPYRNMIMDAMRMNQDNVSQCLIVEEKPNADATRFF